MRRLRDILYGCISNERFLDLSRGAMAGKVLVLMYHEVGPDDADIEAWTVVRRSDFERQMEYLRANFEVVSLAEAVASSVSRSGKPRAVVTFDDGYAGNRRHMLPVMDSLGLPVSIFVATGAVVTGLPYWYDRIINGLQGKGPVKVDLGGFSLGTFAMNRTKGADNWSEIERLLRALKSLAPSTRDEAVARVMASLEGGPGWEGYRLEHLGADDIREMAGNALVSFGAHSHCHNLLTQLGTDEVRESVLTSKRLLEEWTGKEVCHFAYPSGAYDERVKKVLEDCGFACALATRGRPWEGEPRFEIPRVGVGRYDSLDLFKIKVTNALGFLKA